MIVENVGVVSCLEYKTLAKLLLANFFIDDIYVVENIRIPLIKAFFGCHR